MPYIRKEFSQWYWETDDAHGSLIATEKATLEKWAKSVRKAYGKDTEIVVAEVVQYMYVPPAKIEKAKKEDES